MRAHLALWLVVACLGFAPGVLADEGHSPSSPSSSDSSFTEHVPGAAALEGRIIAPCCWNQTIDIHGSESSNALRREIRTRLKAGESSEAIEKSLVDRYGTKIIAVPKDSRLSKTGVLLALAMGVAGVGAVVLLRSWQRRSDEVEKLPKGDSDPNRRDALDERLDAELARLE